MLLSICAIVFFAGCATSTDTQARFSPDPPIADAGHLADFDVEFAYREFWTVLSLVDQQPPDRWRGVLAAVTAEPELSRQLAAVADRRNRSAHLYGEPVLHVSDIRGAFGLTATLHDCEDATNAGEADHAGRTQPSGTSRTPVAATLTRATDYGTWRVAQLTFKTNSC